MNRCNLFQICLIFSFLLTLILSRPLSYDELNEDDSAKLFSNEDEEIQDLESKSSNLLDDNNTDDDKLSYDSYEERKFHQRGLFSSSRSSQTISAHTRQIIIDILQKAFDQGWRPNLKHYIPSTRFGRHRR